LVIIAGEAADQLHGELAAAAAGVHDVVGLDGSDPGDQLDERP
jgi:hypothetical protein